MIALTKMSHFIVLAFLVISSALFANVICQAASNSEHAHVMTVIELQSELMSYADSLESYLYQSFRHFDASDPDINTRRMVLDDIVYSMAAAFTIAGQPNPEVALLDMVVMVSLGRSIYENDHLKKFGKLVNPIVEGFRKLERDIWRLAVRVLDTEQQQELRHLILHWRMENPDQNAFSYIRFSDFAEQRGRSTLIPESKTGGIFKSVQEATQQVEETRMLAERGMYLGTRLPLLTGHMAESWVSQLLSNPQILSILKDLNRVSLVSERMANMTHQLPQQISVERTQSIEQIAQEMSKLRQATIDQVLKEANLWSNAFLDDFMQKVSVEREATINQLMNRIAVERHNALQELIAEEPRVRGLITELRQTLSEGNDLLLSATTLAQKTGLDKPSATPFDIQDYRDTIVDTSKTAIELSTLVDKISELVNSEGMEKLLPQVIKTLDKVGLEGEQIVDKTFRQSILLILILLVGYVLVRLILDRLLKTNASNPTSATN